MKENTSSQGNLKQNVEEESTKEKYKSKFDAMESLNNILEEKDQEDFLPSIDHGEFLVLFKDGDESEKNCIRTTSL